MTSNCTDEIFTQPLSLGLRLGHPAIASPATVDAPIWAGRPPVPTTPAPVKVKRQRRTVSLFIRDEAAAAGVIGAAIFGLAYSIAQIVVG